MIEQITYLLSTLQLTNFFPKNKRLISGCLSATAVLWLAVLSAASNNATGDFAESSDDILRKTTHRTTLPGDTSITVTICANEFYVFNGNSINEPGQYSAVLVASDGSDSIVALQLFVLPLSGGDESATICAGNTYTFNGQLLSQSGIYEAVLTGSNGCDSIATLDLTVLPSPFTKLSVGICDSSFYIFQGDTLTESGLYNVVLPAANGCDSTVTLTLEVVPFFDIKINTNLCAGETYVFGKDTLSTSGVYVDSLTATGGCDSTVTLTLNVLPVPSTHLKAGICTGSGYIFHGDTLDTSGIYTDTLTAANGCDSLVILDLQVADFFDVLLNLSICAGESYVFGSDTLSVDGVYIDSITAVGGCDSTVTLTLRVLPILTGALDATICQGDTLNYDGVLLTEADVYVFGLTGSNGCDSTVTLTLSVLSLSNTVLAGSICQGETYDFNGTTLDTTGVYVDILTAANGCDSIITLTLTVLQVQQTSIVATICAGETYVYSNDTLTTTGSFPFVFTGVNGCDSTVTILLTVLPTQSDVVDASICDGEAYIFDGDTLTMAGSYPFVFIGANGCDSTVTVIVEVLPLQTSSVQASTCDGTAYIFNGDTLTQAGVYTAILTGVNGCDSTVTLTLIVLPTQSTTVSATTCANEPYNFNGQILTTAGDYDFIYGGANGCDSTVTLQLTVLPISETTIAASICAGEIYQYDGDTLTTPGTYKFVYDAANNCDSIVTIELTVRPLLSSSLSVTLCEGGAFIFNSDTLTTAGNYVVTMPGSNGCDSTATLILNFVPGFETALEATICDGDSYDFGGQTLTASGEYIQTLTATGGCDSLVTLTLTVLPLTESTTNASICPGETYTFNGQSLTTSGTYKATQTGSNGCDSTAVLQLVVLPVTTTNVSATICATETYLFNGDTLSTSGIYTDMLTGSNGCDSIAVLTLTVLPAQSSTLAATICDGETYTYENDTLTASGTYEFVLSDVNGCDSTVTLEFSVLPRAQGAFAAIVCNGEPFIYNGDTLATSGTYPFIFPSASVNGCDSVVTLFLTIFPAIPQTPISSSVCEGATYDFYGTPLTTAGTYSFDLASTNGCDSTIVLDLAVLPKLTTALNATICAGGSYAFNGQNLTAPGVYTAQLQSAAGCDSIITLTLLVNIVNTSVTLQGGTLTAQATNATYQWINCNGNTPIQGAIASSYAPAVTGQYAVIVTQGGCIGTSTCQLVQVVSANEPLAASGWNVQPNPAHSEAAVVLEAAASGPLWIELYDVAGRLLQKQLVTPGTNRVDLQLNGVADGLLLVRLVNEQGASTKRLIKTEN